MCLSMLYWWGGKLPHMSDSFIIIDAAQFHPDFPDLSETLQSEMIYYLPATV